MTWCQDERNETGQTNSVSASRSSSTSTEWRALRSAIAHPDRMAGIVLAGCPAFVPGWSAPSFFSLLRTPVLGRLILAELARIDVPVDLRFGMDDPVGGRAVAERLEAALPDATVDILPDAGHLPWLDDPTWLANGIHSTAERSRRS